MPRWFPSWQEARWWVWGGIIYAWGSSFFFIYEPTREWLAHNSPLGDYRELIVGILYILSPFCWSDLLLAPISSFAFPPYVLLMVFELVTILGAALGYALKTIVQGVLRK